MREGRSPFNLSLARFGFSVKAGGAARRELHGVFLTTGSPAAWQSSMYSSIASRMFVNVSGLALGRGSRADGVSRCVHGVEFRESGARAPLAGQGACPTTEARAGRHNG